MPNTPLLIPTHVKQYKATSSEHFAMLSSVGLVLVFILFQLFSSVVTASIASFILGLVMVLVILVSRRFNVNPDNVATPIAASLGDYHDAD